MEEFKTISLALGAAFAVALLAALYALLIRKSAEASLEEQKLPPETLRRIHPRWRSWMPLVIGVVFVFINGIRSGSITSIDLSGPLMLALGITGVFSSVYFLQQWQQEPVESALRKRFGRHLAASVVQIALCAVLFWMDCATSG